MTTCSPTPAPRSALRRALLIAAALFGLWPVLIWPGDALIAPSVRYWLTDYFYASQDRAWLTIAALALATLAVWLGRTQGGPERRLRLSWPIVAAIAAIVFVTCAIGALAVFDRFPLSRDEILADYDAQIFRSGRLAAPVPQEWRDFLGALAPRFMTPVADNAATISGYLPVNALLRALVGAVVDASFTGPLLAALSVLVCFGVGRKLWPQRPEAAAIATLIVALSPQVLATAMTPYAMTAHLTLNLLWLALYLRGDARGHAGAAAIGFAATGLHQFAFHPLFVAPFILRLMMRRQWRPAAFYVVAYCAFIAFWVVYFRVALNVSGFAEQPVVGAGLSFVLERMALEFSNRETIGAMLMLKNVTRFFAWQAPLLAPLLILAWKDVRTDVGIARELAGGIVLTVLVCFAVMPYQGHGWGYRYIHGLIGSAALLAGYGWLRAEKDSARCLTLFGATTAISLVWFATQLKFAHDFALPYRVAQAAIRAAPAKIVLVDRQGVFYAEDLVRNDPFLRNSPLVMSANNLTPAQMEALCAMGEVQIFDRTAKIASGMMQYTFHEGFTPLTLPPCVKPFQTESGTDGGQRTGA